MNTDKMDTSAIFEMFETINRKLDRRIDKSNEPVQPDMTAVNTMTERLQGVIEEIRKPAKIEYQHRHTIDIGSSKVAVVNYSVAYLKILFQTGAHFPILYCLCLVILLMFRSIGDYFTTA